MKKQTKRFCRSCETLRPLAWFGRKQDLRICQRCRNQTAALIQEKIRYRDKRIRELKITGLLYHEIWDLAVKEVEVRWPKTEILLDPEAHCHDCGNVLDLNQQVYQTHTMCNDCLKKKINVRARTKAAIKRGVLLPPRYCEQCHVQHWQEVHHPDYDKSLLAVFLCKRCHRRIHENLLRERQGKTPIPLAYW